MVCTSDDFDYWYISCLLLVTLIDKWIFVDIWYPYFDRGFLILWAYLLLFVAREGITHTSSLNQTTESI